MSRLGRGSLLTGLALAGCLLAGCDDQQRSGGARTAADTLSLRALVDAMLPDLARLARLEPRADIRLDRRTAEQVRVYVETRLDEELPAARIADLAAVYSLLGVIPDTLDLRSLLLELYSEQIVGYYDPHAKTLYVLEGVAPAVVAPVLAHELVHALQDQHANIDSLIAPERGNDVQSAAHAAIEGHATIVMFAFLAEQAEGRPVDPLTLPNPATQLAAGLDAQNQQFPVFRTAPTIIRETTLFPYVAGADFVYRLWQQQPGARPAPFGAWLPQSTEQILHFEERFVGQRDEPTTLEVEEAPPGWQLVGEAYQLGELETGIVLAQHLGEEARALARGWDGDVFRLLTNDGGQRALLWNSVWDDAAAADRFAAAVERMARVAQRTAQIQRFASGGLPGVEVVLIEP